MSIKKVMCACVEHGVLVEMKIGSALDGLYDQIGCVVWKQARI